MDAFLFVEIELGNRFGFAAVFGGANDAAMGHFDKGALLVAAISAGRRLAATASA